MKRNETLFNCDKNKGELVLSHFKNSLLPNLSALGVDDSEVYIGKHLYFKKCVIQEIEDVSKRLRAEWFKMQDVVNNLSISHTELTVSREFINTGFGAILECLQICENLTTKEDLILKCTKHLRKFSTAVIPFSKLENSVLLKISTSPLNNINCPLYQYFHTYLDLQYYMLLIDYFCGKHKNEWERKLSILLNDFLVLSKKNFERHSSTTNSVFICNCMEQFWLFVQILTEKCGKDKDYFWNIFNKVVEQEEPYFVLWLLRDISKLHRFNTFLQEEDNSDRINPNYHLLEIKLKDILLCADSNLLVRTYKIISPLICELWLTHAKIEVYQIMWDFYSKRLNVSNRKTPTSKMSAIEICELVDKALWDMENCTEDFDIFVSMLASHLKKHPNHWPKMKGRIYSQLGPNKVKDLSDIGLLHVFLLFMSLASTVNFEELSKKTTTLLTNIPQDKKNTALVWSIHGALMLRHIQEGRSLENIATLYVQKLQEASSNINHFHLIKSFITTYEIIIKNSANMQLHQWLLLDLCLGKYFAKCYSTDLVKALDVILLTLEKCANADSWSLWEGTFKDNIYPIMKQLALGAPYLGIIGKIVGNMSLLIPSLIADAFSYFNSETISPQISAYFILVILENYPNNFMILPHQENTIIQSWSKVCFLTTDLPTELTYQVIKLDTFPNALKTHLKNSKEPLSALIEYLGSDIKQHTLSPNINRLSELIFEHTHKFLAPFLSSTDNEIMVYRVYKLVSVAFLNCGALLYNRNRSTCALTSLTQCLLFPVEFLTEKKALSDCVLSAVNKTWHIFFEAFVKLNSNSDSFLERTLKSMVTKYLPFFSIVESPVIKCLENETTASVVLEKMAASFFKHPVKEPDSNVNKALSILKDFIQSTTSLQVFKLIIQHVLLGLFEVVIFHSQRNTAVSVLQVITCSPMYPYVRSDFKTTVITVTNKYVQFYAETYFQLMSILGKFIPGDVKSLLPIIKQQVAAAERQRGVGFDKSLRIQLEKLENALEA